MTHDEAVKEARRRNDEDTPPNPDAVAIVLTSTEPGGFTVEWRGTGLILGDTFTPHEHAAMVAAYGGCDSCGACIYHDGCADEQNPHDEARGDCPTCGACGDCVRECARLRGDAPGA